MAKPRSTRFFKEKFFKTFQLYIGLPDGTNPTGLSSYFALVQLSSQNEICPVFSPSSSQNEICQ